MKTFESIQVGDEAELTHVITQDDVNKFVELTGDDNKLHIDKNYASKTSFKKPVAHGMLGASFISTIIGTKLPGDGALWFSQSIEFLLPVRVGDKITVKAVVINKFEKTSIIEMSTDIYNQSNQRVTKGTAKVKVIEQVTSEEAVVAEEVKKRKVALVIGGTGGIGKAVCLQLAKDGFNVAVHYFKNKQLAEDIRDEINAEGSKNLLVSGDITDVKQTNEMINEIVRKLETIDVVVNCSTVNVLNIKFENLEWENIQDHMNVNLKGAYNICKAVLPVMEKVKSGKIINITTQYVEDPKTEFTHYMTAKSALEGFTKSLAVEYAPKGIRFNLVAPGMTDTELIANVPEKVRLLTAAQTPLRRLATGNDVAGAISFLASDKSNFITGAIIRVNGGQVMM
jgi:3-oxoacyl-[acyl-carrier protein] reductase